MTVSAKINTLPVYCTDDDVNRFSDNDDANVSVTFGDPADNEHSFPFCCAIGVIGGCVVDLDGQEFENVPSQFKEDFRDALKGRLSQCGPYEINYKNYGLVMYSLTDDQKVEREVLEEEGWKIMSILRNPKTGNRVTLWGILQNQPSKQPVKDSKAKKKPVRR